LFEDSAAVAGLFIVAICLYLNIHFNLPVLDGVASVLVGLILVGVSAILARESRSLLMGEGISPESKTKICRLIERDASVSKVLHILSTYQSPDEILLMLIVAFKEPQNIEQVNTAIDRIRETIKAKFTLVRFIIIQPDTVEDQLRHRKDGSEDIGI
jgi:divalent metal cation (Fe/Co/Zn/Cd) transporter